MRQKPIVIFHGDCYDGFTAAWVFKRMKGEADFHPAKYREEPPDVAGREVWILDFSYPREIMKKLITRSERTMVLDHHKTAEAELAGVLHELRSEGVQRQIGADLIMFDMRQSGAGMIFDYLELEANRRRGFAYPRHNGQRALWLVDYVEDRDLWRMILPQVREVSAWITSQPMTFEAWDALLDAGIGPAAEAGSAVLAYMEQYGAKALAQARFEEIAGHSVPTVNLPYMNCSEYVSRLLEQNPTAPFAAGYFRRADGRWQFSLRSRGDFDVSELARTFGGGGHRGAAGFEVDRLPWQPAQPQA